jgi:hypothetical protein
MYTLNLLGAVHWQWGPDGIREGRGGTCLEGGKGQHWWELHQGDWSKDPQGRG